MLVLSRHANEEIVIQAGEQLISVIVVDIRGDKVRVGVTADKNIIIHRREVWDEIQQQNAERDNPPVNIEIQMPNEMTDQANGIQ